MRFWVGWAEEIEKTLYPKIAQRLEFKRAKSG